jgi:hypothetical protein
LDADAGPVANTSSTMTGLCMTSGVDFNVFVGRGVPDGSRNDVARLRLGSLSCSEDIERVSSLLTRQSTSRLGWGRLVIAGNSVNGRIVVQVAESCG